MPTDNQPAPLVPVTFLVQHQRYNAGETAGFEPHIAAKLVKSGVARPYDPSNKAPEPVKSAPVATAPAAAGSNEDGDQLPKAKRKDTRKRDRKEERAAKRAKAEAMAAGNGETKVTKGALARLQREAPEGAAEVQEPETEEQDEAQADGAQASA